MLYSAKLYFTNKNCKPTVRITGKLSGKLQRKEKESNLVVIYSKNIKEIYMLN